MTPVDPIRLLFLSAKTGVAQMVVNLGMLSVLTMVAIRLKIH